MSSLTRFTKMSWIWLLSTALKTLSRISLVPPFICCANKALRDKDQLLTSEYSMRVSEMAPMRFNARWLLTWKEKFLSWVSSLPYLNKSPCWRNCCEVRRCSPLSLFHRKVAFSTSLYNPFLSSTSSSPPTWYVFAFPSGELMFSQAPLPPGFRLSLTLLAFPNSESLELSVKRKANPLPSQRSCVPMPASTLPK